MEVGVVEAGVHGAGDAQRAWSTGWNRPELETVNK